ncbi:GNAT family protein [Microbacterium sp. NPDC096154]|uniref:GNAT family N-acetyltransferase n=1 Tax=Microbacterium sp. NPDC096154 TaxID=3155549 RepID=UPI003324BC6E
MRTLDTVDEVHALTVANLDRLRRWESWAHREQTRDGAAAWTRLQLESFARGAAWPVLICDGDAIVGSLGATIDDVGGSASLGYWIDAAAEGRGLVTRACDAVIRSLADAGVARVEIRAAVGNVRSRNVARRLGFVEEGVLRSALPVGGERHDVAVYGLVF